MKIAIRTLEFYLTTIMLKYECQSVQELKRQIEKKSQEPKCIPS